MKTLVLLSGGLDSNVSLAICLSRPDVSQVHALMFDYGQSSINELDSAQRLCLAWQVPYSRVDLDMGDSIDTHQELPARNLIFISQAAKMALQMGFDTVVIGAEPDSTYTDSSEEFINQADALLKMFGLALWAPIKHLPNKTEVVRWALDLGVPLHLCHSSRSNLVDGKCRTSSRFLASIGELFPNYYKPTDILKNLAKLRCDADPNKRRILYVDPPVCLAFKYAAAMFTLAAHPLMRFEMPSVQVFTTGSWGQCLVHHCERLGLTGKVVPRITNNLSDLLGQPVNGDSMWAQWGYKQALSMLPRSRYAKHVACRVTQGHLAQVLSDLGYMVTIPSQKIGICLETAIQV